MMALAEAAKDGLRGTRCWGLAAGGAVGCLKGLGSSPDHTRELVRCFVWVGGGGGGGEGDA